MKVEALLPLKTRELATLAESVAREVLAPRAQEVDAEAAWPRHAFEALSAAGLMGLNVPRRLGGHEEGLLGLAVTTEALATCCASSAICFGMHCVGTAVIAAKATTHHEERYLEPIARGQHITTLAVSEAGSGVHLYVPNTALTRDATGFRINGSKQFVTNGTHADSYVLSAQAVEGGSGTGEFSCLILDGDTTGLGWGQPWNGFGMRGNSALQLELRDVRLPARNLLGEEGDQIWYVFEVIAPYFLLAMAGTYLGLAQAAFDIVQHDLRERRHDFSGQRVADVPIVQHRIAQLWTELEKTRLMIYHAAHLGDVGAPDALTSILACKADAARTAVSVTNEAMTLGGGRAFRENSVLARLLRDARAGHVMSPTTDLLHEWLGRSLLGLPLM